MSLMRNIHLHRTHMYRYGCRRKGPDLSSASIAKWWRVSSEVKAGLCLVRRELPLVEGPGILLDRGRTSGESDGILRRVYGSNGDTCISEIPSTLAPRMLPGKKDSIIGFGFIVLVVGRRPFARSRTRRAKGTPRAPFEDAPCVVRNVTNWKTIARPLQIPAFGKDRNSALAISGERGEPTQHPLTVQNEMRAFQS